jgi:hypothetical protein
MQQLVMVVLAILILGPVLGWLMCWMFELCLFLMVASHAGWREAARIRRGEKR